MTAERMSWNGIVFSIGDMVILPEARALQIAKCAMVDGSACLVGELLQKVQSLSDTTTRFARRGASKVWFLGSPGAVAFLPFCWAEHADASVDMLHDYGCAILKNNRFAILIAHHAIVEHYLLRF